MRLTMWLAGACLLEGLMVATVVSGLHAHVQAAETVAPAANVRDVVINEVAWMGTASSTSDE